MINRITLLHLLSLSCFLVIIACETKEQKHQKLLKELEEWKASNPDWNKPKLYAPKHLDRF